jgi:hypothetical protein
MLLIHSSFFPTPLRMICQTEHRVNSNYAQPIPGANSSILHIILFKPLQSSVKNKRPMYLPRPQLWLVSEDSIAPTLLSELLVSQDSLELSRKCLYLVRPRLHTSLCSNGSTEMSPRPDQAAHRTERPDEHDGGGGLSAIDYRLSRLEMAFDLDNSQDYPTSQLTRAVDVTSQRLLRLEEAAIGRFQEHFQELWHERHEANSATSAPSAHVAADATKQTLEVSAQEKQQVRQRLRYQPPVGIGAHAWALSTPTVINDAGEEGGLARFMSALHPGPSAPSSRSTGRQIKRRLGSLRRLPPMTSNAATTAAEILGAGPGLRGVRPAAEKARQGGVASEVREHMRSEQSEPECLLAQHARARPGARQDEPPTPLVHPCIHTREQEVQAHIALHTDAPRAVADVFYNIRDTVRASEAAAGTCTAAIDEQGNFRAWHPLLLRLQTADAAASSVHSDFAPSIDVNGNFARKPPMSEITTPDTHVQEVQAHIALHTDAPRAVADVFFCNRGAVPVSEAVADTCTAAIDAQGNFRAWHPLLLRSQTADGAAGSNHEDSYFSSFIDVNGNFARKPPAHAGSACSSKHPLASSEDTQNQNN